MRNMLKTGLKVVLTMAAVIVTASCSVAPQVPPNNQPAPSGDTPVGVTQTPAEAAPRIGSVAVLTGQGGKIDPLPGATNAVSIFPSGYVDTDGAAWMWGNAEGGRLGDGKPVDPSVKNYGYVDAHKPSRVVELPPVTQVAGFSSSYIALTRQGEVYVWGQMMEPMAGQPFTAQESVAISTPKKIDGLKDMVQVGAYGSTFFSLDKSGNVWIWGDGKLGQLGDGISRQGDGANRYGQPIPQKLAGLPAVKKIATDGPLAISTAGDLYIWGLTHTSNDTSAHTPTKLPGAANAVDVAFTAGPMGTYDAVRAVTEDGRVLASGINDITQGATSRGHEDIPTLTELPSPGRKAKSISSKDPNGFLVIDEDGNLWGYRENIKYSTRINSGVALLLYAVNLPATTEPTPAPSDPSAAFVPIRIPAPTNVLQVITPGQTIPGQTDQEGELLIGGGDTHVGEKTTAPPPPSAVSIPGLPPELSGNWCTPSNGSTPAACFSDADIKQRYPQARVYDKIPASEAPGATDFTLCLEMDLGDHCSMASTMLLRYFPAGAGWNCVQSEVVGLHWPACDPDYTYLHDLSKPRLVRLLNHQQGNNYVDSPPMYRAQ